MAQTAFVLPSGRVVFPSFVDGNRRVKTPPTRRMSEEDIMAHALWLERHGRPQEAEDFLDQAVSRMN